MFTVSINFDVGIHCKNEGPYIVLISFYSVGNNYIVRVDILLFSAPRKAKLNFTASFSNFQNVGVNVMATIMWNTWKECATSVGSKRSVA